MTADREARACAEELRAFADFLLHPKDPGLDQYTLTQVAIEARARADRIERAEPPIRDRKWL